jgi:hypothetical protein
MVKTETKQNIIKNKKSSKAKEEPGNQVLDIKECHNNPTLLQERKLHF